ncbi:MFS transporter [Sphingomonas sp. SRS2]|uniref:MFS transporter n=1 Tax=Sphingomonas sp. SRS2 TaxID=133190 RepID=UPI0006184BD7|nr:MFS transporter [Sphingomonas sp. SRS2]KKC25438.1 hypothetical protein WP12_14480 [Sphingomonas sp. SRS2]
MAGGFPQRQMFRAWLTVLMLCLLYALSMVDRYLLALLADPVTKSLGLNATQMGLLLGIGFALLYSLVGLPMAHLLDNGVRKRIVVFGVVIWSLSTVLSGFAADFPQLLLARAGVAMGEAVLTPAAISMIGDLFEPEERAFPVAIYSAVANVMSTAAFILGAAALQLATHWSGTVDLEPWRLTCIIVGVPGVGLAVLFAILVKEPTRRAVVGEPAGERSSIGDVVAYLRDRWRFYLAFFVGMAVVGIQLLGTMVWATTLLTRDHALEPATAGYYFGLVGMPAGLAGAFTWAFLSGKCISSDRHDGPLIMMLACTLVGGVGAALVVVSHSLGLALAGLALGVFALIPPTTVLASMLIQDITPPRMQARLIALHLLVVGLISYTLGPLLIGLYLDASADNSVGIGLALMAAATCPIGILSFEVARRNLWRRAAA